MHSVTVQFQNPEHQKNKNSLHNFISSLITAECSKMNKLIHCQRKKKLYQEQAHPLSKKENIPLRIQLNCSLISEHDPGFCKVDMNHPSPILHQTKAKMLFKST